MMNEINKGLRGLGGVKMRTQLEYTDVVIAVKNCVDDTCRDNGCDFDMNLHYFLEGLAEDVEDIRKGQECGIVPKTADDVEEA